MAVEEVRLAASRPSTSSLTASCYCRSSPLRFLTQRQTPSSPLTKVRAKPLQHTDSLTRIPIAVDYIAKTPEGVSHLSAILKRANVALQPTNYCNITTSDDCIISPLLAIDAFPSFISSCHRLRPSIMPALPSSSTLERPNFHGG